jgi:hypothetical protein
MRRTVLLIVLAFAAAFAFARAAVAQAADDSAVAWNRTLVALVRTPGLQPATVHPTRSYALLHVAIFDAVESIARRYRTYGAPVRAARHASRRAAADAAAHDVLTALFPSRTTALDAEYAHALAAIPAGPRRRAGVAVGHRAARRVLRLRAHDGSDATPPAYVTTGLPGDYRPTPPAFAPPVFTHWAGVQPWVLRRGDQFRPGPPRGLARALAEVRRIGVANGSTRTDEQTLIARFWSAPIQDYWNEIAERLATGRLERDARMFAQLDVTLADATIALYDAKYAYRVWRPVTALQQLDPTWTPLLNTPADPSYPGAHSVISAAAAEVLAGRGAFAVTSPVVPGVTRHFASASDAVREAGLSRIYAGVHTRIDHTAGVRLGDDVARWVLRHAFRARQRP